MRKKFSVSFVLVVDGESTVLSLVDDGHEDDIMELIKSVMFDVDDVKLQSLNVTEIT